MHKIPNKLHLIVLAFILSVGNSCAFSENTKYKQVSLEITLPGWVAVSFGIDNDFVLSNKGNLDETYDEFVGGLLDDGLLINKSYWIKPTYGNENLLWTLDANIGKRRTNALQRSEKEFIDVGYEFFDGYLK